MIVTDPEKVAKANRKREKRLRRQDGERTADELVTITGCPLFENDEHKGMDRKQVQEHEEATKIKTIDFVQVGLTNERLKAWYYSPFPQAYHCETLFVCDICMVFYTERAQFKEHKRRCTFKAPPGDEIYRDGDISMFELDGRIQRTYCENLSLVAKLFLDHKTLRFDCEPFHFYVLTERRPIETT